MNSEPEIKEEVLIDYFVELKSKLKLDSIQNGYVIFTNKMQYPINKNINAVYQVIACIKMDDQLFLTNKTIIELTHIEALPYVKFLFIEFDKSHRQ